MLLRKQGAALDILPVLNACPVSLCSDRPYGTTGALRRGKSLSPRVSVFALILFVSVGFNRSGR